MKYYVIDSEMEQIGRYDFLKDAKKVLDAHDHPGVVIEAPSKDTLDNNPISVLMVGEIVYVKESQ